MLQKIAIIAGAGPAGLTAAYELLKKTDIKPIVYEMSDCIGGISQTYNYKGNLIDLGGHRFFSKSKRVMDWWFNIIPLQGAPAADTEDKKHDIDYATEAIMEYLCPECAPDEKTSVKKEAPDPEKEDLVMMQRPRLSRIFFRRNFFPYPLGINLVIAWRLGLLNTVLIACSYLKARFFPLKDETYLDAFFTNRFGRRLYNTFFRDYTEKVWGVPCNQIRADWGSQRIKGLSLKRAVVTALRDLLSTNFQKRIRERETSLITRFYYPKFGPGQMWETVTDQIKKCGGQVELFRRVNSVKLNGKGVTSVTVENIKTGEVEEVNCDYFFSTMPVKHLVSAIRPHPPDRITEVADGLQYRDFLTVGLLLNKLSIKQPGGKTLDSVDDNWIYIQEGDVRVGRVQIFNNWSPYLVKDYKNTVWIGLEYFVNEGGDLWVMPDQELIDLGVSEMEKIGFIKKEDVKDGCVRRMLKAYPAYFGSYNQISVVQEYVNQIDNLFLIGRNGMHRYNNQDHSMLTAMKAVDNIKEGRVDKSNIWEVNIDDEYHEDKQ